MYIHWPFHNGKQRCTKEKELRDAGIAIPDGAGLKKSYTLKGSSPDASTLGILCKPQLLDEYNLLQNSAKRNPERNMLALNQT